MFYRMKAPEQLANNGVQAYMRYADSKLKEEEARAQRYLEGRFLHLFVFITFPELLIEHFDFFCNVMPT